MERQLWTRSSVQPILEALKRPPEAKASTYTPTNRQKLAQAIAGASQPGSMRRQVAKGLVGGIEGDQMGILDFTPAAALFADGAGRKLATPGQRASGLAELATLLPIPGAAAVKGAARGVEKHGLAKVAEDLGSRSTASLTAEQVPFGHSGYQIHQLSPERRQAYTDAAPWTDAGGRDRLSQSLGYEAQPTQQGWGYWNPGDAPVESNPAQVHLPEVPLSPDGVLSADDAATLNFAQSYRGLNDVQAGTPWHVLGAEAPRPSDTYSLRLDTPPTTADMERLNQAVAPAGGEVWNAGDGVTLKTWGDAGPLDKSVQAALPDATPRQMIASEYMNLDPMIRAENAGQGLAVQQVLDREALLPPPVRSAINEPGGAFQQLSQDAGALRGERARQFGVEGVRPDFDRLWQLQAEGGWQRVKDWIAQNGSAGLPVLAGWIALQGEQAGPPPPPR